MKFRVGQIVKLTAAARHRAPVMVNACPLDYATAKISRLDPHKGTVVVDRALRGGLHYWNVRDLEPAKRY